MAKITAAQRVHIERRMWDIVASAKDAVTSDPANYTPANKPTFEKLVSKFGKQRVMNKMLEVEATNPHLTKMCVAEALMGKEAAEKAFPYNKTLTPAAKKKIAAIEELEAETLDQIMLGDDALAALKDFQAALKKL